jgi:hypothetical protein
MRLQSLQDSNHNAERLVVYVPIRGTSVYRLSFEKEAYLFV